MPEINECRLVNDISRLVPWCASLIVQDEEEHLVQFAHPSVKEYLLSESDEFPLSWFCFQLRQAENQLAAACVTYLNLDVFQSQLVNVPQTQIPTTPLTPKSILTASLSMSKSSTIYRSWRKLEKFLGDQSVCKADVWGQLDLHQEDFGNGLIVNPLTTHRFLAYASEYWLSHTVNLRPGDELWSPWKRLVLTEVTVAARPWAMKEWWAGDENVKEYIHENSHWALATLFHDCVGLLGSKQWDSLIILRAAQNDVDELLAHVRREELTTLSALHDAVQAADDRKVSELFDRLLKTRAFAMPVKDSSQTANSRRGPPPVLPDRPGNGVYTNPLDATAHEKYKYNPRDFLALIAEYENDLALGTAACWGHLEAVQSMIRAGLEVDSSHRDQISALLDAVKIGQLEAIQELLGSQQVLHHVKLSAALYLAAKCGRPEIWRFLLRRVKKRYAIA